jgi:phosphoribosylformimino-5-aminoimidazole carboxamide ribotide isomerase
MSQWSRFRPCIDLHNGQVKQIVGGTLSDHDSTLKTNFTSEFPSEHYAELYRSHQLGGGHIIQLGNGNESAALSALKAWPNGLQIGGGINPTNAEKWLFEGASDVIVTSYLFENNEFSWDRLNQMVEVVGAENLIIDLSCRKTNKGWAVATNRWQTVTNTLIDESLLENLGKSCREFLVHAADVEGLQSGMDMELIEFLSKNSPIPCTYAGGAASRNDLALINQISAGKIDLTIGSALDIFGGSKILFSDCVRWNECGHF